MRCLNDACRLSAACLATAVAWLAAGASAGQAPAADAALTALLDSAAAYVKDYQTTLTYILADEQYTQEIRAQTPPQPKMPRTRTLSSTVFFMFVPSSLEWMGIRDVLKVDGKSVADRPDVRAELLRVPVSEVGSLLREYNSRFNIGRAFRNFNEPTVSLLVLDPVHRQNFDFRRRGIRTTGGIRLVSVGFSERPSATPLIVDLKLKPTLSTGELLIDQATGRVHQTILDVTIGGLRVQLSTTYARDERLGVLVPTTFRERYQQGVIDPTWTAAVRSGDYELVLCQANYTNFRRFEASARIK